MPGSSAACAAAESTAGCLSVLFAGCLSVLFAVRHVAACASETRKVNASATPGNGESASFSGREPGARSAQIKNAVSGHQESLIR